MERRKDQILVLVEELEGDFVRLIPCKIEEETISPKSEKCEDESKTETIGKKKYVIKEIVDLKNAQPGTSKEELELQAENNMKRLLQKFELAYAKSLECHEERREPQPSTSRQPLQELQATNNMNQQQTHFEGLKSQQPLKSGKENFSKVQEPQPSTSKQALKEMTTKCQQKEKPAFEYPSKGKKVSFYAEKEPQPSTSKQALQELKEMTKKSQQKEVSKPAFEYPSKGKNVTFSAKKEPQPSTSKQALQELKEMTKKSQQKEVSKPAFKYPSIGKKASFSEEKEPQPSTSRQALQELKEMTKKSQQKEVLRPAFMYPSKGKKASFSEEKEPQPSTSKQALKEMTKMNPQIKVLKPAFTYPSKGKKVNFIVEKEPRPKMFKQAPKELKEIPKKDHQKEESMPAFVYPSEGKKLNFTVENEPQPSTSKQALKEMTKMNQQKEESKPAFVYPSEGKKVNCTGENEPQPSTSKQALKEMTKVNQQKEVSKPAFMYPSKGKKVNFAIEKEPQPSTSKHALKEMTIMDQQKEALKPAFEYPSKGKKEIFSEEREPQPSTSKNALQELQAFVYNMFKPENCKMGKSDAFQGPFKPGKETTFAEQEPQPSTSKQALQDLQAMNNMYKQQEKNSEVLMQPVVAGKETSVKVQRPQKRRKKGKAAVFNKRKQAKGKTAAKASNTRMQSNARQGKRGNAQNGNFSPMKLRSSKLKDEEDSNQFPQESSESNIQSMEFEIKEEKKHDFGWEIPETLENPSEDFRDSTPLEVACVKIENDENTSANKQKEGEESYRVLQIGPAEFIKLRVYRIEHGRIKRDSQLLRSDSSSESGMQTKEFNQIKSESEGVENTSEKDEGFDDPAGYSRDDEHPFSVTPEDSIELNVYRIQPQTGQVTFADPSKSENNDSSGQSRKYMPATYSRDVERSYQQANNHCGQLRVYKFEPRENLDPKTEEPSKSTKRPYRSRSKTNTTVKKERPYRRRRYTPKESFYQIQTRSKTAVKTEGRQKRKYYNDEDSEQNDEDDLYIPRSRLNCFEPIYCLCENPSHGVMVMCENIICPYEWFHFSCVSITKVPRGKWFCPRCRASRQSVMKPMPELVKALVLYNKEKEDQEDQEDQEEQEDQE